MTEPSESDMTDIHVLIQDRRYGFPDFIHEHGKQIDEHVEHCESCREKMVGWTSWLPMLRARMTVQLPKPTGYGERLKQLQQLQRGQCLPCGCEVTAVPWTQEQARAKFCKALSEVMQVSLDDAGKIPDSVRLLDLPLTTKSLRRLRDRFWLPDGSCGSEEVRDEEEGDTVRQLPETIGHFVDTILRINSGISYRECSEHWCP